MSPSDQAATFLKPVFATKIGLVEVKVVERHTKNER
jgi:hypothetical protein